jgi:hypothetical protein
MPKLPGAANWEIIDRPDWIVAIMIDERQGCGFFARTRYENIQPRSAQISTAQALDKKTGA